MVLVVIIALVATHGFHHHHYHHYYDHHQYHNIYNQYRYQLYNSPRNLNTVTKQNFVIMIKQMVGSLIGSSLLSSSSSSIAIADEMLSDESIIKQRGLPLNELISKIKTGKVFIYENFLNDSEVEELRKEIEALDQEGKFVYSGLTNRANAKQEFGKNDRQIYPISFKETTSLNKFGIYINKLRDELSVVLNRPSLCSDECAHESYFSKSSVGASLPRHMDERHEEIKGLKGWLSNSRRSISWLIYLSDKDWTSDNGGELRSYPQAFNVANPVGSDDGNLQLGWFKMDKASDTVFPAFLDIDRRNYFDITGERRLSALYVRDKKFNRKYITKNFDIIDPNTGSARTNFDNYLHDSRHCFYRIEEIEKWRTDEMPSGSTVQDFLPTSGTLVLFDSVSLPHQVQVTSKGQRLALAGK